MEHPLTDDMKECLAEKKQHLIMIGNYYQMLEDTERSSLLAALFDKIDAELKEIQSIDLLFLSKFDQYKRLNYISNIEELDKKNQQLFRPIQELIREIDEMHQQITQYEQRYEALKFRTQQDRFDVNHKTHITSAYKKNSK